MIQIKTKTIAVVLMAIATVGAIGTAGLLVQHANAAACGSNVEVPCNSPGHNNNNNFAATVFKGTPSGALTCTLGSPTDTSTEGHKVFTPSGVQQVNCHA